MVMIFIFGFARKYLQEKKLGHFENPWTKKIRDHVFSNYDFPSQNLNKKVFFSQLVQIHVHEPQSGAHRDPFVTTASLGSDVEARLSLPHHSVVT